MILPVQKDLKKIEVGVDEAGRGCLAGPVVAAAVILDPKNPVQDAMDSKQLSQKVRQKLFIQIKDEALAFGVAEASPEEIDEINILNASFLAMHRALAKLSLEYQKILVDGNRFKPFQDYPYECIVKGDSKYQCIAAASILAKETRDMIMNERSRDFPGYSWEKNVGYPTPQHRRAILELGITPLHRKSFNLLPNQYSLF